MPIRPIKKSGELAAAVEDSVSEAEAMYHRLVVVVEMGSALTDGDFTAIATQHCGSGINPLKEDAQFG